MTGLQYIHVASLPASLASFLLAAPTQVTPFKTVMNGRGAK
jgi:hypothetical protein